MNPKDHAAFCVPFCATAAPRMGWILAQGLGALLLASCGGQPEYLSTPDGGGGGGGGVSGLPCEVAAVIQTHCVSCHGASNPMGGTALASYTDLTATSKVNAALTVAQRAVARMNDGTMPPRPATAVPAADIAAVQAWLDGGSKQGTCQSTTDPLNAAATCTSQRTWTSGDRSKALMNPGLACTSCHVKYPGDAPQLAIGGTVYPTGHEPDLCLGASAAGVATVEIKDAAGKVHTLSVNSSGNFSFEGSLPTPYTAVVKYQGRVRAMVTPQTSGDCNSCHTQAGASGAPGRVTLPL